MKTRVHQFWGMLGMAAVTIGMTGGLWGLAFDTKASTRHFFLGCLFVGISLIFAALRAGRVKA